MAVVGSAALDMKGYMKLSSGRSLKKPKINKGGSNFRNTRILWVLIFALAIVIAVCVFTFFNSMTKQDTYFVTNTPIPARTQITPDNLTPKPALHGNAPQNAISISEISSGAYYAKYPLDVGDVVANSNASPLDALNEGIPDNWTITSFEPDGDDPIVKNLNRGDYFDLMVTNMKKSDQRAEMSNEENSVTDNIKVGAWLFRNVMILDNPNVTTTSDSADKANGATAQTKNSTTKFIIGMSPRNANILAIASKQFDMKMVMSPKQNSYANPATLDALYKNFDFNAVVGENPSGIIASNCVDSNTGDEKKQDCTDPTFQHQPRDHFGVPYNATAADTRDENGDPVPLTKFEIQWCSQLFGDGDGDGNVDSDYDPVNGYYSNSKWDKEKKYCASHSTKTNNFKKMLAGEDKAKSDAANQMTENRIGSTENSKGNKQSSKKRSQPSSSSSSSTNSSEDNESSDDSQSNPQ